jgi:hypothetical protein
MNNEYTLRQQIEAFQNGNILDEKCSYFYDWFCRDQSLKRKACSLMTKVKKFVKVANIDLDKTYVFFKNNCPFNGSLYDDFRIYDRETGDVIFTVAPSLGYTKRKGEAEVWGSANSFKEPLFSAKSWSELLKTFVVA